MSNESLEKIEFLDVSSEFLSLDTFDFKDFLRMKIKENPSIKFHIIIDWVDKMTTRKAKAFFDDSRFRIESIIIRATRVQYEEDVNAFESGVHWEEKT